MKLYTAQDFRNIAAEAKKEFERRHKEQVTAMVGELLAEAMESVRKMEVYHAFPYERIDPDFEEEIAAELRALGFDFCKTLANVYVLKWPEEAENV